MPDEITGRNWDPNEPFRKPEDGIIDEKTDGWEATVEEHNPVSPLDRPSMWRNEPISVDRIMWYLRDIQSELGRIKVALRELSEHLGVREQEW